MPPEVTPTAPPADSTAQGTSDTIPPPVSDPVTPPVTPSVAPAGHTETAHVALDSLFLPDEFKNDPAIKDAKTVTDLAKQAIHAHKLIGANKMVIPGVDAGDEEWAAAHKMLGCPDTPADYNLKLTDQLPEGTITGETVEAFATFAHSKGLSAKQAGETLAWFEGITGTQLKAFDDSLEAQYEATKAELTAEFGNATQAKLDSAKAAFNQIPGGKEFIEKLVSAHMDNDVATMRFGVQLAAMMGEDRLVSLEQRNRGLAHVNSPAEAQAEISKLQLDKEFRTVWMTDDAPGHKEAVKRLADLYKDAYPEPAPA